MTSAVNPNSNGHTATIVAARQVTPTSFERSDDEKADSKAQETTPTSKPPSHFEPQPVLKLKDSFVVYQKKCAISRSRPLATPSFGGCYVLSIHDPVTKWTLLAHIDDCTSLDSLDDCLKSYMQLLEEGDEKQKLARLQVGIRGGWKDNRESNKWGSGILLKLVKFGILAKQIDKTDYQKKSEGVTSTKRGVLVKESPHHFTGGIFNPATGKFQYFENCWQKIDDKCRALLCEEHTAALQKKMEKATPEAAIALFKAGPFALELPLKLDIIK